MTSVRLAERAGRSASEDRIFVTDQAVLVLDGASQPERSARDGGWFATELGTALQARLWSQADVPLQLAVADAIAEVSHRHDLTPGRSPSATLSIARWSELTVEALVLGDTPVVVERVDGTLDILRDDRLADVAGPERRALRAASAHNGFAADNLPEWRALVDAQRQARNRPGGYWIAEASPEAAERAECRTWPAASVSAVLVVTDGVAAGPDKYGIPASWALAVQLARQDPAMLIDAVHQAEVSDPNGDRWPRSKRHDDKAAAFVELGGAPGTAPL